MAEVGLVAFTECALQIAESILPKYRSKFSKHLYTQPQLLTILCLMRYADWTFREAEVRVNEHSDLRTALKLEVAPDFSTLHRFLSRIDEAAISYIIAYVIRIFPNRPISVTVAVDSTGLTPTAVSTFFIKRARDRGEGFTWRHWLKWTVAVEVERRLILSQMARRGPYNDCAKLRSLLKHARRLVRIKLVVADAEFDSERNHRYIRKTVKAFSIIPAKRGKRSWKIKGVRAEMRKKFPKELYGQRSLIESVFSTVKRKLSARAPGRSVRNQRKQALLLGLAYDLYRF
jgi:DDE family transposase/transposase-like protein DUF772